MEKIERQRSATSSLEGNLEGFKLTWQLGFLVVLDFKEC